VARRTQGNDRVHCRCRFACAAFFIGKYNDVRITPTHDEQYSLLDSATGAPLHKDHPIGASDNVQSAHTLQDLSDCIKSVRTAGTLALVPTMGALHAGHMALVTAAKARADQVAVSIFVNPKQFGPHEDFDAYPRPADADVALLIAAGVDLLWMPGTAAMYPTGFATTVSVSGLPDRLCGAARPGHFDGVATVVAKLLGQIRPDIAVFGEKDWQQLAIIRRMVADLDLGAEIVGVPILRASDGLALSSRNAYLSDDERKVAPAFHAALMQASGAIISGAKIDETLAGAIQSLLAAGFSSVDYVELVDAQTLDPMHIFDRTARLIAAARLGKTRLIDNVAVSLV
jgi:pantoate--beta-alanine ligase